MVGKMSYCGNMVASSTFEPIIRSARRERESLDVPLNCEVGMPSSLFAWRHRGLNSWLLTPDWLPGHPVLWLFGETCMSSLTELLLRLCGVWPAIEWLVAWYWNSGLQRQSSESTTSTDVATWEKSSCQNPARDSGRFSLPRLIDASSVTWRHMWKFHSLVIKDITINTI